MSDEPDETDEWWENEWTIEKTTHPRKRLSFSHTNDTLNGIRLCGEGFQGMGEPMPKVEVNLPTYGPWSMVLNSDREDGTCSAVPAPLAREIWAELVKSGWVRV